MTPTKNSWMNKDSKTLTPLTNSQVFPILNNLLRYKTVQKGHDQNAEKTRKGQTERRHEAVKRVELVIED